MPRPSPALVVHERLGSSKFVWLWAKFVRDVVHARSCTRCLAGPYSKVFSAHNPDFDRTTEFVFDGQPLGSYAAIYICGVAKKGYRKKLNYPHNLHTAIQPVAGVEDEFHFEDWHMRVRNGRFLKIPTIDELPPEHRNRPPEFVTCRIWRWAVVYRPNGATLNPWRPGDDEARDP